MKFCCSWILLNFILVLYSYSYGSILLVSNYGAYPNDNLDDTNGIQLAIDEAINDRLNTTVIFGFGIYNLSSAISIVDATNLTITGQGIDQTFLVGNSPSSIFTIQFCQDLTISSLSIDFDPLPFTAGYVINVNKTYLDLEISPPHQADINRQVSAILRYDPIKMRPSFGPNTYEIYQTPLPNVTTSLVSPGILPIPLSYPTNFRVGDAIVARYGSGSHVISGGDAKDLTIKSINIYTSWCMGFAVTRIRRLNVMNYHVLPRNQRWMSTTADCLNFLDSREYVNISDSKCSSMGDDGLSVHAMYFIVKEIVNSTTLIIHTFAWSDTLNVGIGTILEFSKNQQPFTPYTKGTVASITSFDSTSRIFTFINPINVNINDYVVVSDVPQVIVKNLTVENNRARGILLQTRNIVIKQSILNQTSGPGILFQPFAKEKGMITILPDLIQLIPIITNVEISSSTFHRGNYSEMLIQSYNENNISVYGNYITTNNLSSLIDIPPSAFNSSFPPPV